MFIISSLNAVKSLVTTPMSMGGSNLASNLITQVAPNTLANAKILNFKFQTDFKCG